MLSFERSGLDGSGGIDHHAGVSKLTSMSENELFVIGDGGRSRNAWPAVCVRVRVGTRELRVWMLARRRRNSMQRKTTITLALTALLGAAVLVPGGASAQRGGMGGAEGGMGGSGGISAGSSAGTGGHGAAGPATGSAQVGGGMSGSTGAVTSRSQFSGTFRDRDDRSAFRDRDDRSFRDRDRGDRFAFRDRDDRF